MGWRSEGRAGNGRRRAPRAREVPGSRDLGQPSGGGIAERAVQDIAARGRWQPTAPMSGQEAKPGDASTACNRPSAVGARRAATFHAWRAARLRPPDAAALPSVLGEE